MNAVLFHLGMACGAWVLLSMARESRTTSAFVSALVAIGSWVSIWLLLA